MRPAAPKFETDQRKQAAQRRFNSRPLHGRIIHVHLQVLVDLDAAGRALHQVQLARKQVGVGARAHADQHQRALEPPAALQHRRGHLDSGRGG